MMDDAKDKLLFAMIGLDFGTSSIKIIVRLPYEPSEPTLAIPAPAHCRSMDNPYLWQTVLWIRGNGEFIPYTEQDAHLLHTLKQGVMGKNPNGIVTQDVSRKTDVKRIEATSAYLTFVIRYVKGWLVINRPKLFRGRKTRWVVNVGLPAADYDNETVVHTYRKAATAALKLADFGGTVSDQAIRSFLLKTEVQKAMQSKDYAEELGITVIPETAAAATAFAKSTQSAIGLYLMVDVGAMTLDVCAFRLNRGKEGRDQYPLLKADVRPLGVEAYHWYRTEGRSRDGFLRQNNHCLRSVVWNTKKHRDPKASCWKPGNELSVFLTGGGAGSKLHRCIPDCCINVRQIYVK